MRIAIGLLLFLAWSADANNLSADQCKALYQAWLLNQAAEQGCHLDQCVSYKIGTVAKAGCSSVLSQSVRDDLTRQVLTDLRSDIKKNGQAAFCAYITPGHDALMQDNDLCAAGAKP